MNSKYVNRFISENEEIISTIDRWQAVKQKRDAIMQKLSAALDAVNGEQDAAAADLAARRDKIMKNLEEARQRWNTKCSEAGRLAILDPEAAGRAQREATEAASAVQTLEAVIARLDQDHGQLAGDLTPGMDSWADAVAEANELEQEFAEARTAAWEAFDKLNRIIKKETEAVRQDHFYPAAVEHKMQRIQKRLNPQSGNPQQPAGYIPTPEDGSQTITRNEAAYAKYSWLR